MFRIYTKEVIAKEKFTINLTQEEVDLVLEGDYFKDHKDLDPLLHCVIEQDYPFEYPTYDTQKDTIREMTLYERYKNKLYELTKQEVELKGEIVKLEPGQYLDTATNSIITVEKIEGLKVEWNWDTHTWEDLSTDLEKIQAQIKEYSELDTPSTLKEMGSELANECMNMLIELRNMAYTLGEQAVMQERDLPIIPKPSKELEAFKNKFKKFF